MSRDVPPRERLGRAFEEERSRLFGLCYRLTGSVADADELVQETFVRALVRVADEEPARPLPPLLTTLAARLSIDRLRHRKSRAYIGPYLPAPLETENLVSDEPDAESRYGVRESVSFAFMVALEALTPKQRAVLVLRDVMELDVGEVAEALGLGESDVKVSHHRARTKLADYDASRIVPAEGAELAALGRFVEAASRGDWDTLASLLAEEVCLTQDGAGEGRAARKPVVGRARVVTFQRKIRREGPHGVRLVSLNGAPALLFTLPPREGYPARGALSVALDPEGRIRAIYNVLAQEKLAHLEFPPR